MLLVHKHVFYIANGMKMAKNSKIVEADPIFHFQYTAATENLLNLVIDSDV